MKQIKETEKLTTIILEDGDVLEIVSLGKGNDKLVIKCLSSILHIDELTLNDIQNMQTEKEEIKKMDQYLKERDEN